MKNKFIFLLILISINFSLFSDELFKIIDNPNDNGTKVKILWNPEELCKDNNKIFIYRKINGVDSLISCPNIKDGFFIEEGLEKNTTYDYKILLTNNSDTLNVFTNNVTTKEQYFNFSKMPIFISSIIYFLLIIFLIKVARSGKSLYIRPLGGINAIDEAIGRATEMGKPILYVPGLTGIGDIATIASITILERVAKKAAQYDSKLLVPVADPIVLSVAQEVVKEAHISVGRPDSYNSSNIFYISSEQFPFVAGVNGVMLREKPATNFFIGMFFAESLILAETGSTTGAIQISGTDAVTQIPFFITTCDYTLMGEELYAASAYLSSDPLLLSTLKAQDYAKAIIMAVIVIGTILLTFGNDYLYKILSH